MGLYKQPNIFLIVLDTMRLDYIECYNSLGKTPNIKRLCEDSEIYVDAISPSSWTIPSHASMFTGQYVSRHGVHETQEIKKWEEMHSKMKGFSGKTLAESLKDLGYNTVGLTANSYVGPGTGFDRGFNYMAYNIGITDYFYSKLNQEVIYPLTKKIRGGRKEILKKTLTLKENPAEILKFYIKYKHLIKRLYEEGFPVRKDGDHIIRTLKNSSFESPAFFFINFMEVHEPYKSLLKKYGANFRVFIRSLVGDLIFSEKDVQDLKEDYLEESELLDSYIGELISYLKSQGEYENSLMIVTSDHGQALYEKGFFGHGIYLFDELVRVPLIIKYPSSYNRKGVIRGYFNIKDLYKLIIGVAKGEGPLDLRSQVTFSETYGIHEEIAGVVNLDKYKKKIEEIDSPRKAVFKDNMKLVLNLKYGKVEEFNVSGKNLDPKENQNKVKDLLDEIYIFKGKEKMAEVVI